MSRFNYCIVPLVLFITSSNIVTLAEQICQDGVCWPNYVPAPPGKTPACAKHGGTFCQSVYGYPAEVIETLVTRANAQSFLSSESMTEFRPKEEPRPVPRTQYPAAVYQTNQVRHGPFPNPNYKYVPNYRNSIPPGFYDPNYKPTVQNGWTFYNPPSYQYRLPRTYYYPNSSPIDAYNPADWLKRMFPVAESRKKRQASLAKSAAAEDFHKENLKNIFLEEIGSSARVKRQNADSTSLCQSRSRYVDPQAALNVNGDWKYVVNSNPTSRQMVKTEQCASDNSSCSNLCSLPNGYVSSCSTKYVQKRLVALQADGTSLYTDTFWFPSCCICSITLRNSNPFI